MASVLAGLLGSGTVGSVVVRVGADTKALGAGLASAKAQTSSLASTLGSIGGTLTKSLSLPIALVGAAATKMALDFEDAFVRIAAVTNTSTDQIDSMKESVLALAAETGRAPEELAEALYFLASSGLNAEQQMQALEVSAKAAAVGLGTTDTIARITSQAMNAYADSGLTAAHVTDTLVAAIREGTAEPDEFADALGRILPIAHQAGITFDQVAASLAVLSNIGLDVDEGVTAMRGLLQALEAPGTAAANALEDVGLSADEVRRVLQEDGLLAAMQLLMEATGGNIDALRDIIPNIRALTGQLGIMGQDAEKTSAIFDAVRDSTGALGSAFAETAEGPGFKMQQALTELKIALIQIGDVILPIVTDIAGAFAGLARAFSSLDPGTQSLIVKLGLILAAIGPVTIAVGGLIRIIGGLGSAISLLVTQIGLWTGAATTLGAVLATGGIAVGIGLIVAAVAAWIAVIHEHNAAVAENVDALLTQKGAYEELAAAAEEADKPIVAGKAGVIEVTGAHNALAEAAAEAAAHIEELRERFASIPGELSPLQNDLIDAALANHDYATALDIVTGALDDNREAIRAARAEFNQHRNAVNETTDAIRAHMDVAEGLVRFEEQDLVPAVGEDGTAAFDDQAAAVAEATRTFGDYVRTHQGGAALIANLLARTGGSFSDFRAKAAEAAAGGQEAWAAFAADIREKWSEVRTEIATTFDFVGPALSQFFGDAKFNMDDLNDALKDTIGTISTFGEDFATVAEEGKGNAQAFLDFIAESGPQAFGLLHEVATAAITDPKAFDEFIGNFNKAEDAQSALADQITVELIGTLDALNRTLQTVFNYLTSLPGFEQTNLPGLTKAFWGLAGAAAGTNQGLEIVRRRLDEIPPDGGTNMPSVRSGFTRWTTQAGLAATATGGTHRELSLIPRDSGTNMPSVRSGLSGIASQAQGAASQVYALKAALLGIPANTSASIIVHIQEIIGSAEGFHGVVDKPTLFLVAEAGEPERVDVTPMSKGGAARPGGSARGRTSVGPTSVGESQTTVVNTYHQHHFHIGQLVTRDPREFVRDLMPIWEQEYRRRMLLGLSTVPSGSVR